MKKIFMIIINNLISSTALQAFNIYTIWYMGSILHDQHLVSIFGAVAIINIFLIPIGGLISDHYSKILLIKWVSIIRSFLFLIFCIFYFFINNFGLLAIIINIFLSILNSFYVPSIESIAPDILKNENDLAKANSILSISNQLSVILGSIVGGILIIFFSIKYAYTLIGIILLISFIFVIKIQNNKYLNYIFPKFSPSNELKKFIKIFKFPIIKILLPYSLFMNISFWEYWYLMPIYLNMEFKNIKFVYSLQDFTLGITSIFMGGILSINIIKIKKLNKFYPILLLLQSIGIATLPIFFIITNSEKYKLIIFIISWIIYGIFSFITGIIFITYVQKKVPKNQLGSSLGIIFSLFGAIAPISAAISGIFSKISSLTIFIVSVPMIITPLVMIFDKRIPKLFK